MNRTFKKVLASIMMAVMVMCAVPFAGFDFGSFLAGKAYAMDISSYNVGDTITFGSYPQSKVTDSETLSALDKLNKDWISYGYYLGTGTTDGFMEPSDFMKYCDLTYGEEKYRAVTFSSYRPYGTELPSSESQTYQKDNGYYVDTVYYFRYEPLTWRVLDPTTGYVMCDRAIDAQAYQNIGYYVRQSIISGIIYNSMECKNFASDWGTSSIREWLNKDFYNTAFTESEREQIATSNIENTCSHSKEYDGKATNDKIFIPSFTDIQNAAYGFNVSYKVDTARQLDSTDYANCQGCYLTDNGSYQGKCAWITRTPVNSGSVEIILYDGRHQGGVSCCASCFGTVPAFKFNGQGSATISMGDVNCDGYVNSVDALLVLQYAVKKTTFTDEQMIIADVNEDTFVNTIDAMWILEYAVGKRQAF